MELGSNLVCGGWVSSFLLFTFRVDSMKTIVKLSAVVLAATLLAGCAGQGPRTNTLLCTTLGALAGGAGASAVGSDGSATAGAAVAGAALGMLLCAGDDSGVEEVVVAAVCADTPPVGALLDAQGCATDDDNDGVVTGVDLCIGTSEGVTVDSVGCALDDDQDAVANYLDLCPATPYGAIVDPDGCPLAGQSILSLTGVNFAFDTAELTADSQDLLGEAVALLEGSDAVISVQVEGHTDSTGDAAYNQGLSEQRAQSVVDYLVSQGIDANSLIAVGMGEAFPVAGNDTKEGRAANRRVDFIVEQ